MGPRQRLKYYIPLTFHFSAFSDFLPRALINVKLPKVYTLKRLYTIIDIPLKRGAAMKY